MAPKEETKKADPTPAAASIESRRSGYQTFFGLPSLKNSTEDIQAALKSPVEWDFVDLRLDDAISYINDYQKQKHPNFEIVLDKKALAAAGVPLDLPITFQIKDISLRSALRLMLSKRGLTYILHEDDQLVLVTTREEADKSLGNARREPREVIRQALTKKVNWNFEEKPLREIVKFLQEDLKIPVRLDPLGLNEEGIANDLPLTLKVSGISAKAALNLLLDPLFLKATFRDEILLITSRRSADRNVRTVVYDVADLVIVGAGRSQTDAKSPSGVKNEDAKVNDENASAETDFDSLMDMITESIKPCDWDRVGGNGSIRTYEAAGIRAIVVTQTNEVHEEIAILLSQLRALKFETKGKGTP